MAAAPQLVLRRAFCALCGEMFFVCRRCERGQRYCGTACRQEARRRKCREYNRKYQDKKKGRLKHALRQEAFVQRQALARASKEVTDHSLEERFFPGKLVPEQQERVHSMNRCWFCGRPGVVIPATR